MRRNCIEVKRTSRWGTERTLQKHDASVCRVFSQVQSFRVKTFRGCTTLSVTAFFIKEREAAVTPYPIKSWWHFIQDFLSNQGVSVFNFGNTTNVSAGMFAPITVLFTSHISFMFFYWNDMTLIICSFEVTWYTLNIPHEVCLVNRRTLNGHLLLASC